jgi:hypothetical protein
MRHILQTQINGAPSGKTTASGKAKLCGTKNRLRGAWPSRKNCLDAPSHKTHC